VRKKRVLKFRSQRHDKSAAQRASKNKPTPIAPLRSQGAETHNTQGSALNPSGG